MPATVLRPIMVDLSDRSYPVYVEQGLICRVGVLLKEKLPRTKKCAVVTDEVIYSLHGEALERSFNEADIEAPFVFVPEGEKAKSWDGAGELVGELLELGLDRLSAVVAFGGGVVGDLAGFVASIYLRGISLVQVPTTLLAQVDSSVGGKTAIDHPEGKNLIGSFHHPVLVVSDPETVQTLPEREVRSGLGEVIKYGVVADAALFSHLEACKDELLDSDPDVLTDIVKRCVSIKAKLVGQDERDIKGVRAILNYGHTLGHALEILTGFQLNHGEAVAIGMVVAAKISKRLGLIEETDIRRLEDLLKQLGFNTEPPSLELSKLLEVMHRDKKTEEGSIRFVLPTGIGSPPILKKVSDSMIISIMKGER